MILFRGLALVCLLSWASSTYAQGVINQAGPLVAGDAIMAVANNIVRDAGDSTFPANPGSRLRGIGVVNSGLGVCQWNTYPGRTVTAYNQICIGFDSGGNGVIDYSNNHSSFTGQLFARVNGVELPIGGGGPAPPGKLFGLYAPAGGSLGLY